MATLGITYNVLPCGHGTNLPFGICARCRWAFGERDMTQSEQIEHNRKEIEKLNARIADPNLTEWQRDKFAQMKKKLADQNVNIQENMKRMQKIKSTNNQSKRKPKKRK